MAKKKDTRDRHGAAAQAPSPAAENEAGAGPRRKMKRDITLPERQKPDGHVQPDLPLRRIPTPF